MRGEGGGWGMRSDRMRELENERRAESRNERVRKQPYDRMAVW